MAKRITTSNWKVKGKVTPPNKMSVWEPYGRRPKQHQKTTKNNSLQGHRLGRG